MKKIYLISILSIFTMSLFCQGMWTKRPVTEQEVPKPVMVPGSAGEWDEGFIAPGSVMYYENTYHMWYWGGIFTDTSRVGHATSPDGIKWTKDTNNPVMDVGPNGDWDDNGILPGSVLVIDSVFHTWYTGHTGPVINENYQIGHATSQDGITWIKDTNNPVISMGPPGTWDETWVAGATVINDGSEYHMWYTGWDGVDDNTRIGHATSPDALTWTKDVNNPVLTREPGSWEYPGVETGATVYNGLTYHMWYSGGYNAEQKIGHAVSEDGRTWVRDTNNPVLEPGPNNWDWDNKSVDFSAVLFDYTYGKEKLKMWYNGTNQLNEDAIGYADMPMPDPIIKPVVWLYNDTTTNGENFYVQCNKEGCIYIVPPDTEKDSSAICTACNGNFVEVSAGLPGSLKIIHPEHGIYWVYAIDTYGNISEPVVVNLVAGAIDNKIASQIRIYPNPFSDFATIGLPENIRVRKIEVVDITGRTLRTVENISGTTARFERDNLPGGLYLIRIQADDIYVKKVIIR